MPEKETKLQPNKRIYFWHIIELKLLVGFSHVYFIIIISSSSLVVVVVVVVIVVIVVVVVEVDHLCN